MIGSIFRRVLPAVAFAAASMVPTVANAAQVLFNLTGPNSATFTAEKSPTPNSSGANQFFLYNVAGTLNGSAATYSYFEFWTSGASGGFTSSTDTNFVFDLTGPQLFTGSTTSPTFTIGNYTLANGYSLSISEAVPEPATWAMMLLGFGAIGFSMRRRGRSMPPVPQTA